MVDLADAKVGQTQHLQAKSPILRQRISGAEHLPARVKVAEVLDHPEAHQEVYLLRIRNAIVDRILIKRSHRGGKTRKKVHQEQVLLKTRMMVMTGQSIC